VALKFLTEESLTREDRRVRFLREARLAAALNHPAICTIYEVAEVRPDDEGKLFSGEPLPAGTPFIAMELIEGWTLSSMLKRSGALPLDDLLHIAVQVAEEPDRFAATLTFLGKSAHGSRPYDGHNAAVDALGYLVRLGFPPTPALDFLGLAYCAGKDLSGEYLGIAHRHPFIGPTTASLNIFELDLRAGQAQINVRFPLGLSSGDLLERVREKVAEKVAQPDRRPTVEFEGVVYEPLFTDPEQYPEFFAAIREAYQTVTGREPRLKATGGTTYAKGFPRAVSFGPVDEDAGEPDMAHKADEFTTVPVLVRNTKIYACALAALSLA